MENKLHTSLSALPDQSRLIVKYSGDALTDGVMDIEDLAPALSALRRTIVISAGALNSADTDPHVFISAETRAGSFEFIVIAAQALTNMLLANADHIKSSVEVVKTVFGEGGVVELIKMVGGKRDEDVHQAPLPDGDIAINVSGSNNSISVTKNVFVLSKNTAVREALWEAVEPLTKPGIASVSFDPPDSHVDVSTNDATSFRLPSVTLTNKDEFAKSSVIVTVIKPAFAEGRRWRLLLGDKPIGALMEDKVFQSKVMRREILFGTGDKLRVELATRTHKKKETEYFIERVHEVIRPPEQLGMSG